MKKVGAIVFLVCSIASIVISAANINVNQYVSLGLSIAALVGIIFTGSKGIWVYIFGALAIYVASNGWLPVGITVNTILGYVGVVLMLIAIIICWKDAIVDLFKHKKS